MGVPAPASADLPGPGLQRPASAAAIFRVFNRMALQGFGGVLAVAQRELVERTGWLTQEQFLEALSVGQVLPGPNIINVALMIGDGYFGLRGAMAAIGGLLAAPLVIVMTLAVLYAEFSHLPMVAGALRGMGAVAAGLVVATAVKLARTMKRNPLGVPTCSVLAASMFGGMALEHWPLWVMLACLGPVGMGLAWRRLARG